MKMQAIIALVVVGFLSLILTEPARAETTIDPQPVVGGVDLIQGKVYAIGSDGDKRRLHRGSAIHEGETIKTIGEGSVVILMLDGTQWDIYDETELVITEYNYAQKPVVEKARACDLAATYLIVKGQVTYTSGKVTTGCTTLMVSDYRIVPIGTVIEITLLFDEENNIIDISVHATEGEFQWSKISTVEYNGTYPVVAQGEGTDVTASGGATGSNRTSKFSLELNPGEKIILPGGSSTLIIGVSPSN